RAHTAVSIRSRATISILRMTFFSILTNCDSFLARSGPQAPAAPLRKAWPDNNEFKHTNNNLIVDPTYQSHRHHLSLTICSIWSRTTEAADSRPATPSGRATGA